MGADLVDEVELGWIGWTGFDMIASDLFVSPIERTRAGHIARSDKNY